MCTESHHHQEISTIIGKVSHGSEPSVPPAPFSTSNRGATMSFLAKLKQLVKKVIVVRGAGRRRGGGRKSDSRRTLRDDGFVVETELDNVANENKSNVANCNSKMAYTIEELKDIVDDNLANELREIRARENL